MNTGNKWNFNVACYVSFALVCGIMITSLNLLDAPSKLSIVGIAVISVISAIAIHLSTVIGPTNWLEWDSLTKDSHQAFRAFETTTIIMIVFSGYISCFWTPLFFGHGPIANVLLSAALVIVISLLKYALIIGCFLSLVNKTTSKRRKCTVLLALFPIAGVIFITSIIPNTMVWGQHQAVKSHYSQEVKKHNDYWKALLDCRLEETTAINTVLKQYIPKYTEEYEKEIIGAGRTGLPNYGSVAYFLKDLEQSLRWATDYLTQYNSNIRIADESSVKQINQILANLDDKTIGVYDMARLTSIPLHEVRNNMFEFKVNEPLSVVKSVMLSHLKDVRGHEIEILSSDPDVAKLQLAAISTHKEELLAATIADIEKEINHFDGREIPSVPELEGISPMNAIFHNAKDIAHFWEFAMVIDFWGLFWVIAFIASDSIMKRRKPKAQSSNETNGLEANSLQSAS